MKRILSIFACFLASVVMTAGPNRSPQEKYIARYAELAVEEMYRSGVPASITLAQGLLESRYGLSELAVKGNNHFGIKCHNNWRGKKMYHDYDRKGECFRVYKTPAESFRDHSDFLRYRDRYKFLFDLNPTDYKGWANGLKKAGYATDPAYPKKLIRLIEEYDLHDYDKKSRSWARKAAKAKKAPKAPRAPRTPKAPKAVKTPPVAVDEGRPESPNSIEQAKPLDDSQRNVLHLSLTRQMYSRNGVPFVKASAGETYESIAAANNLFLREILKFNDQDGDTELAPGTVVYLQAKKKQAAKGLDKHIVEEGDDETLWDISQRYGIRMKELLKLNGISSDRKLTEGEVIRLRK